MALDFADLNEACLEEFGQTYTYKHAATGDEQPVVGVIEAGPEPESTEPGEGSVYALLFLRNGGIAPPPAEGDEVSSGTTVYKYVRQEPDVADGTVMLLRKDRDL